MSKKIIVGIATVSGDIETWEAPEEEGMRTKLCNSIARNTHRSVYLIEGEIIGKFSVEVPVVYHQIKPTTHEQAIRGIK